MMEDQLNQLIKRLADDGLKEAKEIAIHSESIAEFISYMEFDRAERQQAIDIANEISTVKSPDEPLTKQPDIKDVQEFRLSLVAFELDMTRSITAELERIGRTVQMRELDFIPFSEEVRDYVDTLRLDDHREPLLDTSFSDIKEKYLSGFMSDNEIGHWQMIQLLSMLKKVKD